MKYIDYTVDPNHSVVYQKEYNTTQSGAIGLAMMVKNEEKRLPVTLNSVASIVKSLIMYDTGSTDNTIQVIKDFGEKHKINTYILKGEFVDFSASRNVYLDFAEKVPVDYLLLLDSNDELKNGNILLEVAKQFQDKPNSAFLLCQHWWTGRDDMYYNIRLVKNRHGWRYFQVVHEYIKCIYRDPKREDHPQEVKVPPPMVIYQDRTMDDDRSMRRFTRDEEMLSKEHKKNPDDSRVIFYLAQTYQCLGKLEECLFYSKKRLEQGGFEEEIFHSLLKCGACTHVLTKDWHASMMWYLRAYEQSGRVEPLIKIADHYRIEKKWDIAYMFAKQASECVFPEKALLFVDNGMYEYYRWFILAVICTFLPTKFEEGKKAILEAVKHTRDKEATDKCLKYYTDKEKEKTPIKTRKKKHKRFIK